MASTVLLVKEVPHPYNSMLRTIILINGLTY